MPSKALRLALSVALPFVSLLIFLATGEIALRLIYPGGGRMTLGAPGYPVFEHVNVHDQQRGRLEWGEKVPGEPRVMILGDSITWGTGVRRWEDTWPEQLALSLEQSGRPHQFAVLSLPGRDVDAHVDQLKIWGAEVRPDVLIYQWYVNDLEIIEHRPAMIRSWQQYWWHAPLRARSYLYYFIDNRLQTFLPPPERSYVDYILTDFIPGSIEWAEFERQFHSLATRAREIAPTRILMLYPQVPFKAPYPLLAIHDRMKALARAESLSIPPVAWSRAAGSVVTRPDGPWKQAVRLPAGAPARAIATRAYYASGSLDIAVTFAADAPPGAAVATVELVDLEKQTTLLSVPLVAGQPGSTPSAAGSSAPSAASAAGSSAPSTGRPSATSAAVSSAASAASLQTVHLRLALPTDGGRDVQIAIGDTAVGVDIAGIDLRVDYGFEVLDLTETMNSFDTHVSVFDAHPNPAAHKVIAQSVAAELERLEQGRKD